MNTNEIKQKLQEFEASEEFARIINYYKNDYELSKKHVPTDEELRLEVLHDYELQLEADEQCKTEGHRWEETNFDGENGCNDLECQRCGQIEHIRW